MKIVDTSSGKEEEARIEEAKEADFKMIKSDEGFLFDWDKERVNEVYKTLYIG